jgi:HlyD family secretion protein
MGRRGGAPNDESGMSAQPGGPGAATAPGGRSGAGAPGRAASGGNEVPNLAPGGGDRGSANGEGSSAGTSNDERRNRFAQRMQNLSPEEREAAMARMRDRGFDPASGARGGRSGEPGTDATNGRGRSGRQNQQSTTAADRKQDATTIDALFAPLPRTESTGRAWLYAENQLRPVRLRLGISDGQNTELLEGDVTEGAELVTNVSIAGQSTRPSTQAFPGFGGRGGFGGNRGGGPGGGGRGR